MSVWLYNGPDSLRALTSDPEGGNLPDDLGPWTLVKAVTLRTSGSADEQEAIALITEHGYCCFE